jgi:hypothetical protein
MSNAPKFRVWVVFIVMSFLVWKQRKRLAPLQLSYLVQRREPARLLLLGTYRPEDAVVRHHPVRQLVQELSGRGLCTEGPGAKRGGALPVPV